MIGSTIMETLLHVWEEEATLSDLTNPFIVPVKQNLLIFINGISEKKYRLPE